MSASASKRIIPIVMDAGALSDAARSQAATQHAADPATEGGPAPVFVFVGDTPISEAEIAREMQHHRAMEPQQSRQAAARALAVRELLRQECARLQIGNRVAAEEEAAIEALLAQEVITPEPTEADCRHYFESNRERMRQPDRIHLRHILLAAAKDDVIGRARACTEGEKLIADLLAHPERFVEFAQRFSACPSKDDGGDLGWIERGATTPEFERQVFMLNPGLAGLTVESRWGHHVVRVEAIERGEALSYAQARPRIAAYLETQVKQNALHQYLQILADRHGLRGLPEWNAG